MVKTALVDHRPWLFASVTAALAFYFLWNNPIAGLWLILLKGAGVGLLAVYAFYRSEDTDGLLIVLVLAIAAGADMALELDLIAGGALFALSHLVAILLFWRNRRTRTSASQKGLAAVLLIGAPLVTWLLARDPLIVVYALTLGGMAAAAWMSRFPRYRVGIGAVLFVLSDWLIFSRMGKFDIAPLPDLLIWPLYYAAQLMIATGVVQTLRGERTVP